MPGERNQQSPGADDELKSDLNGTLTGVGPAQAHAQTGIHCPATVLTGYTSGRWVRREQTATPVAPGRRAGTFGHGLAEAGDDAQVLDEMTQTEVVGLSPGRA